MWKRSKKKRSEAKSRRAAPLRDEAANDESGVFEVATEHGIVSVPYIIKRSRRARYLRLSLNFDYIAVLTLPMRSSRSSGLRFLESKADWVLRNVSARAKPESLYRYLQKNPWVTADGKILPVRFNLDSRDSGYSWDKTRDRLELQFNPYRMREPDLVRILRAFATDALGRRCHTLAQQRRLPLKKTVVRDQSSRWGSCSTTGTVSLNWRLLLLDPAVQDYVVWHELAHLSHLNHSRHFWQLLEHYDPEAETHDKTLSQLSQKIMYLGRKRH